jgi:hypothetical protein
MNAGCVQVGRIDIVSFQVVSVSASHVVIKREFFMLDFVLDFVFLVTVVSEFGSRLHSLAVTGICACAAAPGGLGYCQRRETG